MYQTINGLIISTVPYNDSGFVCRIFTENYGLKTFLVQSGRSQKSSKRHLLQPLMPIEFEAAIRENAHINRLKDLRIAFPLNEIYRDPVKSSMVLFINELLAKTIPDDYVNSKLYRFLWNGIRLLDDAIDARNFHIWCILEISRHYGFYPYTENEDALYFDLSSASFTNQLPAHSYFLEGQAAKALLGMLDKEWTVVQPMKLHSSLRRSLLESLVTFLKLHLENFREIKSLEVLHIVFH